MGKKKKRKRTGLILIALLVVLTGVLWVRFWDGRETDRKPSPSDVAGPRTGAGRFAPPPPAEPFTPTPLPSAPSAAPRKIAILIDDIGHDLAPVRELLRLGIPLNFAVLPYSRHAREAAETIHGAGQEVLLHLPMEPVGYPRTDPGEGALLTNLSDAELSRRVERALNAIPHIRGVNNHMGSAFMAHDAKMRLVLNHIAARNLYFVDSRTTANSRAEAMAALAGVPFVSRDVFLDNGRNPAATLATLRQAVQRRPRHTHDCLLMIGHPYPETVIALREILSLLKTERIEPVLLSSLLLEEEAVGR